MLTLTVTIPLDDYDNFDRGPEAERLLHAVAEDVRDANFSKTAGRSTHRRTPSGTVLLWAWMLSE